MAESVGILYTNLISKAKQHTSEDIGTSIEHVFDHYMERMHYYPLLDDDLNKFVVNKVKLFQEESGLLKFLESTLTKGLSMYESMKDELPFQFSKDELVRALMFRHLGVVGFQKKGSFESLQNVDGDEPFKLSGFNKADASIYNLMRLNIQLSLQEYLAVKGHNQETRMTSYLVNFVDMIEGMVISAEYERKAHDYEDIDDQEQAFDHREPSGYEYETNEEPEIMHAPEDEQEKKEREVEREKVAEMHDKKQEKMREEGDDKVVADFNELFGDIFND